MKNLYVVVDGLFGLSPTQTSKIKRLADDFQEVIFVLYAYNPYSERQYFVEGEEFEQARQDFKEKLDTIHLALTDQFELTLDEFKIQTIYEKNLLGYLKPEIKAKSSSWILFSTADHINRHSIHLHCLRSLNCPVLMLSSRGWPKQIAIACGIDPVHQNDLGLEIDENILSSAKQIAKVVGGKLQFVHARYVPALLHEFAQAIKRYDVEAIQKFITQNELSESKLSVPTGNPELVLPKYVLSEGINLLVIGAMARREGQESFIGTTAESLLRNPPCDSLLV